MRIVLAVLTGVIACVFGGQQLLDAAVDRVVKRAPPFTFTGLKPQPNGVDLHGLTVLHRGRAAEVDVVELRWAGPLGWTVRAPQARVIAERTIDLRTVTARQQGDTWQIEGTAELAGNVGRFSAHLDPGARRAAVESPDGWLFRGRLRGADVQVRGAVWHDGRLRLTGIDAARGRARWQDGSALVERAPCGWRPTLTGGVAWYGATDGEPASEPSRAPESPSLGCPVHVEDIYIVAATPLGVRTAELFHADLQADSVWIQGRTAGADGAVLAPLSRRWAVGEGTLDLGVIAELLGRTEIGGDAVGNGWILRDGERIDAGIDGRIHATVVHPAIAEAPVALRDLNVRAQVTRTPDGITLHADRVEKQGVVAQGEVRWTAAHADVRFELEPVDCQTLWSAIPAALRGPYHRARLSRRIAPQVHLRVPRGDPMKLSLDWKGPSECDVDALKTDPAHLPPAQVTGARDDVDWLTRPFRFPVQYAGRPVEVGPGTKSWVPLDQLPRWVGTAAIVSEDNAFNRGKALNLNLLRRALMFNLDRGRYVYGGSTIPQQLVKNLFLTRRKTLARKLQEAVVAMRLVDQLTTRQVLELYLNCIEFAPNVYGIERAARFYFQKGARQLTPKEAAFLAIAKPAPRYTAAMRRRGATPATAHFHEYMRRIIERMRKRGAITAAQAAAARPFRLRWRGGRKISEARISRNDAHL